MRLILDHLTKNMLQMEIHKYTQKIIRLARKRTEENEERIEFDSSTEVRLFAARIEGLIENI